MKLLTARMNWIKPAQMAPMLSAKYTARDGLVIHGYLTVPVGHQPKNLPLQDDIEDAARWAIASGLADPRRIAIMAASYGGYSALFGLGHNPELYRCGIALAAVTDWPAIFDDRQGDPTYKKANRHWRQEIGDPDRDSELLKSISPVYFAGKIKAPVLIIQGKEDRTVPPDQARRMITALDKAGRILESLFIPDLGHGYGNEKQRTRIYEAITVFLEANLGPDVR